MNCPFLIEQIVAFRIDRKGNEQMIQLLRRQHPSEEILSRLATIMAAAFPSQYPIMDMDGEAMLNLDLIQRLFPEERSGDWHV